MYFNNQTMITYSPENKCQSKHQKKCESQCESKCKNRCKDKCRCGVEVKIRITDCRYIYSNWAGHGNPTIILVTGLGERADNWMTTENPNDISVFKGASKYSKVIAYDRPGTATIFGNRFCPSRSSPRKTLATIKDSAMDLHLLLKKSGRKPPYILVGHSLGGPIIRLYASEHPKNVAGFVFVDALSEDLGNYLTEEQLANFELLNDPVTQGRPPWAEQVFYSQQVVPLLRSSKPLPKVPTIILTADIIPITSEQILSGMLPPFVTQEFVDALWKAQLLAQNDFAAKFPCAKHITNTNAGHYIHLEQPELVIRSIKKVLKAFLADKVCF